MNVQPMLISIALIAANIAFVAVARHKWPKYSGWLASIIPFFLFGYGITLVSSISAGSLFQETWTWIPGFGIDLSFYLDGFGLLFFLLITGIGGLVLIYGGTYLNNSPQLGRFYTLILIFMTAMVGLAVSDNLILLFVFWEITSISSYLLIGFKHYDEESRKSALRALVITGSGGLSMLAGLILLNHVGGSFNYSELLEKGHVIRQSSLYLPILILLSLGAFTKSAQFPFHFWLPGAMSAPTPVSSYLHSATMVKAGFFLMARIAPVLGYTDSWHLSLMIIGTITMLFGALMAVAQTDLKKLLAYSTISALGLLFLLLGINTELSIKAAILFLIVHALYKGALFMIAGIIDHTTGTRDVTSLNGLIHSMPIVGLAAFVAAFSMSGLPPLLGFIGKELIYEAKVQAPGAYKWLLPPTIFASALNVAIAFIVGVRPFFGLASAPTKIKHKVNVGFWLGPVILAIPSLLFGIFPFLINRFSNAAASALRGEIIDVKLSLWHGFNLVLLMSAFTVLAGFLMFAIREKLRTAKARSVRYNKWGPKQFYETVFAIVLNFAKTQTDLLQNGRLRFYISHIMAVVVLAGVSVILRVVDFCALKINLNEAKFYEWVIAASLIVSSFLLVLSKSRMVNAITMGIIGYSVALIFVLYSAPDLAITQILVETLTVVLFVSVVYTLPRFHSLLHPVQKTVHFLLSVLFGIVMTLITLNATNIQIDETISNYFVDNSLSQAFGRNIVNVILVDFRALDTLGEIAVLGVAALGVFALLRWQSSTKGGE